jgi:hypothetical protein
VVASTHTILLDTVNFIFHCGVQTGKWYKEEDKGGGARESGQEEEVQTGQEAGQEAGEHGQEEVQTGQEADQEPHPGQQEAELGQEESLRYDRQTRNVVRVAGTFSLLAISWSWTRFGTTNLSLE